MLDSWWTDAAETQARDRIWRLGSKHDMVYFYALHATATVDDVLQKKRAEKRSLALDFERDLAQPE